MILLPKTDDAPNGGRSAQAPCCAPNRSRSRPGWRWPISTPRPAISSRASCHFLRLIVLSILLLSIGSGMSRNVLDRYREIGTMMALGATRASGRCEVRRRNIDRGPDVRRDRRRRSGHCWRW
jgi:hypothetical protein